ncbi:MAG: hypothetical protein ACRCUT_05485, partial [Spirochaetota bacterium]
MKIAAEITAELTGNTLPALMEIFCSHGCEIISISLTGKNNNASIYEFHISYTEKTGIKKILDYCNESEHGCRIISLKNYLDDMVNGGLITVQVKMKIDSPEDYQINVLGLGHLISEKIQTSDSPQDISGIRKTIALFSGIVDRSDKVKKLFYILHSQAEMNAAIAGRFLGINAFPLISRFDIQEDILKFLKSLEAGFSGIRID